jgi:hypothetical protein
MPCYDPEAAEYNRQAPAKINELTRLLCAAVGLLRGAGVALPPELTRWAETHDKTDRTQNQEGEK